MKIKVNITGFGERYCSNNVECFFDDEVDLDFYQFYKKGTNILHNEYGPAVESKYGYYQFLINNKLHRLSGYSINEIYEYHVLGKYIGTTKKQFIKNLANVLIPIK